MFCEKSLAQQGQIQYNGRTNSFELGIRPLAEVILEVNMKKNSLLQKTLFISAVLAFVFAGGCSGDKKKAEILQQRIIAHSQPGISQLPECSGGIALSVGYDTITVDDVVGPLMTKLGSAARSSDYESFCGQARPEVEGVLAGKISSSLLYQQAKKNASENIDELLDDAAEKQVSKFIASFGGDRAEAEKALKKVGMDWESFKESQKKMMLTQSYVSQELEDDSPVSHTELLEYYNTIREKELSTPSKYQFRLIDIRPEKLDIADPNADRLAEAKKLADEIVGKIKSGADFAELAKKHSNGHRAEFGGLWRPFEPGSLAAPYDVLEEKLMQTETGEIAGPIENSGHIFILRAEDKQAGSFVSFQDAQHKIESAIKLDRRKKAINKMMLKLAGQVSISNKEQFIKQCLKKIYTANN